MGTHLSGSPALPPTPALPNPRRSQVEVFSINSGQHARFPCQRWLGKDEPPYELAATLFPAGPDAGAGGGRLCKYRLTVFTSDVRNAGTDAVATAVLSGEKGATPALKLENSANNFERWGGGVLGDWTLRAVLKWRLQDNHECRSKT